MEPPVPADSAPAVSVRLVTMTRRSDFVAASNAKRQGTPGVHLQACYVGHDYIGVGYTCSKKVGNAVARNRAKRRLREVARLTLPTHGKPGWDYVLVGRKDVTASRTFGVLMDDLISALQKVHR